MLMYAIIKAKFDILTVNLRTVPVEFDEYNPINIPDEYLIDSAPHPVINFLPYLYNEHSPMQRKMLLENNMFMKAYRLFPEK